MANVELSNEEIKVFQNADFLLTKNIIFQKMQQAFGHIAHAYQQVTQQGIAQWQKHCVNTPKISKGEQYEGLPYLMLDYPRNFSHTDTFAIRSFCWWGHYFSISLLLTGESQLALEKDLIANPILRDWHVDTASTPWQHEWDTTKSPKLISLDKEKYIPKEFFKLSKQIPLSQWQEMSQFFVTNFQQMWTAVNYPNV